MKKLILLFSAVLIFAAMPALPVAADDGVLIHFDCIDDGQPLTPDRPHTDIFNDPPNDLQCLATGDSVLGPGTVHPNLEISSPNNHNVVKNRAGHEPPATFGAPNGVTSVRDNCFEWLDTGRKEIVSPYGAWGFGDISACAPTQEGVNENSKVELNFNFLDIPVSQFSIRMLDYGDYNPGGTNTDFQVTLTAYNAADEVVDTFNHHHTILALQSGSSTSSLNPGDWKCYNETGNSCVGGGTSPDLYFDGDACSARDGQPGYLNLEVQGPGIVRVELRMISEGFDSCVGFDSIRFTEGIDETLADLCAGQYTNVGNVNVWNDADYLYVQFAVTDPEWCITQTHVDVGTSLEELEQNKNGNPQPGHFPYINDYDCVQNPDRIMIDLNSWDAGTELYIAAHAVVSTQADCNATSVIYGTERGVSAGGIYEIDLAASPATATLVFSTGLNPGNQNSPNGNAFDAEDLRLYYSSNDSGETPSALYFHELGTATQVNAGNLVGFAAGAAFYDGKYYYIENRTDALRAVSFNADGTVSSDVLVKADFTGSDEIFRFGDIVIRSSDGMLFGSAQVRNGSTNAILRNEFFEIYLATNTYTQIASFPIAYGTRQLAFGSDGTLFGHNASNGEFFTVDPDTGTFTYIGFIGDEPYIQFTDLASGALCVPEFETAWGDGNGCEVEGLGFPGKNWATYFTYTVQE